MERLYLNAGGYKGECIGIDCVMEEIEKLAIAAGWRSIPIEVGAGEVIPAYERLGSRARFRAYLSSGIHGDEPAGPLAMLELFRQDRWPEGIDLWAVPCLNPAGYRLNSREDEHGTDLNRDYLFQATAPIRAHVRWLEERPSFDLTLLLHEDWESNGFYLYELNPDHLPSMAGTMIRAAARYCPVDLSPEIEGRPAEGGVIRPRSDVNSRQDWPEAFYLIHRKTRLNYTLESPSDFPLRPRALALMAAVRAAFADLELRPDYIPQTGAEAQTDIDPKEQVH